MPIVRNTLFPPLDRALSVRDRVRILATRHDSNYYVGLNPALVPKESRPSTKVTHDLLLEHLNKRTKLINRRFAFFLFTAPTPQQPKLITPAAGSPAT